MAYRNGNDFPYAIFVYIAQKIKNKLLISIVLRNTIEKQ